ncbi:zinc ribbon domain-containing protein [Camelimonas abortus]|uniref:Zinc ribbon domain-containing protein n=1 Tax=Camelimonas abortus TaxID=1017184 RepID=A0ABV7LAS9_9HYPH
MPTYDYECAGCGPFVAFASMARYADPCPCPECGAESPRAFIHTPMLSSMSAGRRFACETNERSANAPRRLSKDGPPQAGGRHGANCSCCSGRSLKAPRKTLYRPDGTKSFPTARPWMISH